MSVEPWKLFTIDTFNTPLSRSAKAYVACCEQFDVVTNKRYERDAHGTYCNIYVWDCTRALSCEIPHWPSGKVGVGPEMRTKQMREWMQDPKNGWMCLDRKNAELMANEGKPVVMSWEPKKPGIGHVAMLLPGGLIAQAGAVNLWKSWPKNGFGAQKLSEVLYFAHL